MPDLDKLNSAIDAASEQSYSSETDDQLAHERALSIDYFLGNNVEPAPEGRSQVVDRTVFTTIQGLLPSLSRIFAGGDNVVEFDPLGPDDEEPAQQESDYLNYIVTQKNPWFDIFTAWAQDALLSKNGYCMAFMDESIHAETETYRNQSPEQLALLLQDGDTEIVEQFEHPDTDSPPQPLMDDFGQPIINDAGTVVMVPPSVFDVTVRRAKRNKRLTLRVLPPERCKISHFTPDHTLRECPYFEFWEDMTISDIRAMGFEIDDDIASDSEPDTEEDDARDRFHEQLGEDSPSDPSRRRVRFRMVWIRHDYDEDGIAEMQLVYRIGRRIIYREEVPRIHVASLVPHILTHRHVGISEVDITGDIQRISTSILRSGLDNLYQTQNMRMYLNADKVNLDDAMVNVPGAHIRNMPGQEAVFGKDIAPIAVPFVFPQAIQGLEYMETVTEARTGLNRNFTGVNEDALRGTATAVNQLSTLSAQRVEHMARLMAAGVRELFSICHELILRHGHKAETVRLRGQWVQVDPKTWRTGRDMRISVGFGAGNKDAQAARVATILAWQEKAAQSGSRVVTEQNLFEALSELVKVSDFNTDRFFTDPETLGPPPPPPPDPLMVNAQADRESKERIEGARLEEDSRQADLDAQLKVFELEKEQETKLLMQRQEQGEKIELEQVRAGLRDAPIRIETQKIDDTRKALDSFSASQSKQTEQIGRMLEHLEKSLTSVIETVNAPREIVRDKNGRAIGVKVNGRTRKLKRDERGRLGGVE